MKSDCHLFAITNLVCDAGVIWVEVKANTGEALAELLAVEETCYHGSVYDIQALYNELCCPLFVGGDKGLVDLGCNVDKHLHKNSMYLDDRHIRFILYSSLNKSILNVNHCDILSFFCVNDVGQQFSLSGYHWGT